MTGVDVVEKALDRATKRTADERMKLRLLQADVTKLGESEVGSGFRLLLDTGTFPRTRGQ